jgi:ribonuclease HII
MKKGVQELLFEPDPKINQKDFFENHYLKKGYKYIVGVDEAGRGPLAGPVVAAAVILPKDFLHASIKDSKKLNEKKREELYGLIHDIAISVGIGIVHERQIEEINILSAALLAMKTAISELEKEPDFVLVDGNVKLNTTIPQKTIKQGDSKSISIAAASIIAKVTRDRIMYQYHRTYPSYNFKSHKGYGTKEHIEAIKKLGITKIHRRTFAPIKEFIDDRKI